MPSIRRNPSPKLFPELLIGIVIALAVTGIPSIVQKFLDRQKYESAIQHYEMGSCVTAVEQFNHIVSAFRLTGLEQNSSPNRASNLLCVLQIRHHYLGANGQVYKIWLF
jgi:hypothetical protein